MLLRTEFRRICTLHVLEIKGATRSVTNYGTTIWHYTCRHTENEFTHFTCVHWAGTTANTTSLL